MRRLSSVASQATNRRVLQLVSFMVTTYLIALMSMTASKPLDGRPSITNIPPWSIQHSNATVGQGEIDGSLRLATLAPTNNPTQPNPNPTTENGLEGSGRQRPMRAPPAVEFSVGPDPSLKGITPRATRAKVIDSVLFNTELDILELRMLSLYDVVDWFVVIEANYTFQNNPKKLFFHENRKRFAKFADKIAYYAMTEPTPNADRDTWAIESQQRNAMGQKGIQKVLIADKGVEFADDDLVFTSDVDEILRADVINWLAWNTGYSSSLLFNIHWNIYGFMWLNPKTLIDMRCCVTFGLLKSCKDEHGNPYATNFIRRKSMCRAPSSDDHKVTTFGNPNGNLPPAAGWHCSWCFPVSLFSNKLESFSHVELNLPQYKNYNFHAKCKLDGKWFADKPGDVNPIRSAPRDDNFAPPGYESLWGKGKAWEYLVNPASTGDEPVS